MCISELCGQVPSRQEPDCGGNGQRGRSSSCRGGDCLPKGLQNGHWHPHHGPHLSCAPELQVTQHCGDGFWSAACAQQLQPWSPEHRCRSVPPWRHGGGVWQPQALAVSGCALVKDHCRAFMPVHTLHKFIVLLSKPQILKLTYYEPWSSPEQPHVFTKLPTFLDCPCP